MRPDRGARCLGCTSFDLEAGCLNMVQFIEGLGTPSELTRKAGPDDFCDEHQTEQEAKKLDAAIALFWHRLRLARHGPYLKQDQDRSQAWE